jgi:hypothetical protein
LISFLNLIEANRFLLSKFEFRDFRKLSIRLHIWSIRNSGLPISFYVRANYGNSQNLIQILFFRTQNLQKQRSSRKTNYSDSNLAIWHKHQGARSTRLPGIVNQAKSSCEQTVIMHKKVSINHIFWMFATADNCSWLLARGCG